MWLWQTFRFFILIDQDLDLAENPVGDKRLLKLIQQCRTKQVLDYVKQHGEDAPKSGSGDGAGANQKSKAKKSKKSESSDEPKYKFNVQRHTDDTVKVWTRCQTSLRFVF